MAVLSGVYPEKCQAKYGSLPLKSSYYREMALRILLLAIDTAGNRHGRHIEPWLSISVRHSNSVEQIPCCSQLKDILV